MKEQVRVEVLEVGHRTYVAQLWRKGRTRPSFETLEMQTKRGAVGVVQMLAYDLDMEIAEMS